MKLIDRLLGKSSLQPYWERLYRLSLSGMHIGRGDMLEGSGERWVLDQIAERLRDEPRLVVFDVGANVGDWSELALETFGNRAAVYAFEPQPGAFARLEERFTGRDAVHLGNFGAGDEDRTREFWSAGNESPLGSLYPRDLAHVGVEMRPAGTIDVRRLDGFCDEQGIDRIHLLKLDVEGNELNALVGCGELLSRGRIDFIQFEFGGTSIDSRIYLRDFYELLTPEYELYRIVLDGVTKLGRYEEVWELFTATNFLAARRPL